jgi:hypothetical protein
MDFCIQPPSNAQPHRDRSDGERQGVRESASVLLRYATTAIRRFSSRVVDVVRSATERIRMTTLDRAKPLVFQLMSDAPPRVVA